jgi:hypothetical protein
MVRKADRAIDDTSIAEDEEALGLSIKGIF